FFMVRVARLQQAIDEGDSSPDLAGRTPAQQLAAVSEEAHQFVAALDGLLNDELLGALAAHGLHLTTCADLNLAQRASMASFFKESVQPVLTPLGIDIERPFPLLATLSLNLAVLLDAVPGESTHRLGIVQVPAGLNRLVKIESADGVMFV